MSEHRIVVGTAAFPPALTCRPVQHHTCPPRARQRRTRGGKAQAESGTRRADRWRGIQIKGVRRNDPHPPRARKGGWRGRGCGTSQNGGPGDRKEFEGDRPSACWRGRRATGAGARLRAMIFGLRKILARARSTTPAQDRPKRRARPANRAGIARRDAGGSAQGASAGR